PLGGSPFLNKSVFGRFRSVSCLSLVPQLVPMPKEQETFEAPHPGSQEMPRWDTGKLIDAPRFTWKNWFALLGPGLVLGGASIGGGEWLLGPRVAAQYGGSLLWLTTLSVLGQV